MKIVLMRHGRPDFDFSRWIRVDEFACIAHEYDTAAIVGTPPAQTMATALRIAGPSGSWFRRIPGTAVW